MKYSSLDVRLRIGAWLAALCVAQLHCSGSVVDDAADLNDTNDDSCGWAPVLSEGGACYSPVPEDDACCPTGGTDLSAHCAAAFPGSGSIASKPVSVLCANADMPVGLDCAVLPETHFSCSFGKSVLICCPVAE